MGVLKWNEYADESRAQIGELEFVILDSINAWLYINPSSFYSGGQRFPSVADAKERAEEIARDTHAALSEAFAPVLKWRKMREGRYLGTLGDWALDAYDDQFVVLYRGIDLGGERVGDLASAKAAAVARLRKIGVAFRVEDGEQ